MSEPKQDKTVLEALIARLEEWAECYSRSEDWGLGYPSASLIHPLHHGSRAQRFPVVPMPLTHEAAEEIEAWVCEMAEQNANMARALRCYYFYPGSLRQQAARLEMSLTQYRLYFNMAQQWLVGRSLRERGKKERTHQKKLALCAQKGV